MRRGRPELASGCMLARPECGTGRRCVPQMWWTSELRSGIRRASKILGTPVGSRQLVHEKATERAEEERRLWEAIPHVPDLQCAWQILLQCAGPRCHHMLPPTQSEEYAQEHDASMQRTKEVPWRPQSWGLTRQPESQTCTFQGPGLQKHHQIFTKGPPREKK